MPAVGKIATKPVTLDGFHRKVVQVLCFCRDMSGGFVGIGKHLIRDKLADGFSTKATLTEVAEAMAVLELAGMGTSAAIDIDGLEEVVYSTTTAGLEWAETPLTGPATGTTRLERRLDELQQRLYELRKAR